MSQRNDQILRQPVRELKSMNCLSENSEAVRYSFTHTHTKYPHVVFRAVNLSAPSEQQEGNSQQVRAQQQGAHVKKRMPELFAHAHTNARYR